MVQILIFFSDCFFLFRSQNREPVAGNFLARGSQREDVYTIQSRFCLPLFFSFTLDTIPKSCPGDQPTDRHSKFSQLFSYCTPLDRFFFWVYVYIIHGVQFTPVFLYRIHRHAKGVERRCSRRFCPWTVICWVRIGRKFVYIYNLYIANFNHCFCAHLFHAIKGLMIRVSIILYCVILNFRFSRGKYDR